MRTLALLMVALFASLIAATAQAPPGYGFGFISQDDDGDLVLHVLDAATLRIISRPLAYTAAESLMSARPSPDRQQLALWFNSYRDSQVRDPNTGHVAYFDPRLSNFVRLLDLVNGETRDMMHREFVFDDFNNYQRYDLLPSWSPDGRYLLFDHNLYDAEQGQMLDLGFNRFVRARSWSPDSQQLAIAMTPPNLCCTIDLTVFSVPDMEVRHRTSISEVDICRLGWSPDQSALIFEQHCFAPNSSVGQAYSEIYYWPLAAGKPRKLTDLADLPTGNGASGQIAYNTVWLDAENLLLSSYHYAMRLEPAQNAMSVVPRSFEIGTFLLHPPSQGAQRLNTAWSREFALEPTSGLLAYESLQMDPATAEISDQRVEIARFDGRQLIVQAAGPAGQGLYWSPEGDWLAYSSEERQGFSRSQYLHFLNAHTGQQQEYLLPPGEVTFVGWQHAPEFRSQQFPQGTPTPVPTRIPGAG